VVVNYACVTDYVPFPLMRSILCQSLVAAVYLWILSPYRPYRVGDGLSTLVMDGW
jgi:hypothetical protein